VDKADLAIAISAASALFTGVGLLYTRKLAKNDTERMKRKTPALEIGWINSESKIPGWEHPSFVVRNLEHVGLMVRGLRAKRGASVYLDHETRTGEVGDFGERATAETLPEKREALFPQPVKVEPLGTPQSQSGRVGDTLHLWLYTKGVRSSTDLELLWEWADGQKR